MEINWQTIFSGVALAAMVLGFAVGYGRSKQREEEFKKQHKLHFEHRDDDEARITQNEKDIGILMDREDR